MIELTCPQCHSDLEIDDGFRGGVCRCFNCGTLMTVPDDPEAAAPERLERPDAPDQHQPMQTVGHPEPGPTTYRTTSGRVVELSAHQISRAPTARKRRVGVRVGTIVTIVVIMIAMFVAVMYSVSVLLGPKPTVNPEDVRMSEFGYDPKVNPFTFTKPNFMGVPVTGNAVLMSDSSSAMRRYSELISQAMLASARTMPPSRKIMFVFWNESAPAAFPPQITPAGEIKPDALRGFLEGVYPAGGISAGPAIARAIKENPSQIVLVFRQPPMPDEMNAIAKQIDDAGVRLDAIVLDGSSDDFKKIATESGGNYIELPASQLQDWYQEFTSKQDAAAPEAPAAQ